MKIELDSGVLTKIDRCRHKWIRVITGGRHHSVMYLHDATLNLEKAIYGLHSSIRRVNPHDY